VDFDLVAAEVHYVSAVFHYDRPYIVFKCSAIPDVDCVAVSHLGDYWNWVFEFVYHFFPLGFFAFWDLVTMYERSILFSFRNFRMICISIWSVSFSSVR